MGTGIAHTWGTTAQERSFAFPCDRHLHDAEDVYYRGVDVAAAPEIVFRWLCQLRVAPYSYDWIDNLGQRSPRRLTAGLEHLATGQRVMRIFELVEFEPDRHLTILLRRTRSLFGEVAVSYLLAPVSSDGCRLLVKVLVRHSRISSRLGLGPRLLPWGDLIMMRRQLLTLRDLSVRQAASGDGVTPVGPPGEPESAPASGRLESR